MQIEQRKVGDVAILSISGEINFANNTAVIREKVGEILGNGTRKLLMDIEYVTYVDSSGVTELVTCYKTAKNQNGQLKLLNPTQTVKEMLASVHMDRVFEIHHDEGTALASFA